MKLAALAIALALIPASNRAQGYLVPNGVTYGGYVPDLGSFFLVLQNPTNGEYTGFTLMSQDSDTFQIAYFLDERVRVFFVVSGQPVALEPIQSNSYVEYLEPADFMEGVPFYLGLYTGYFPQNGVYQDPLFGWAQLVNNGGVIELLDSALTYGADGIYVGTQNIIQPVPEPGILSLFGLGLLALLWRRRQGSGARRYY